MRRPRTPRRAAERATFAAAIGCWTWLLAPAAPTPAAPPSLPPTRTIGTAPATPAPVVYADKPAFEHWTRRPESDVVAEPYGISIDDLRALAPGQVLSWPDPDGGALDLAVVARDRAGDLERIRLVHDGLPSTVTLGARTFYATIATARGAYAISNDAGETLLVRHTDLDRRMLPGARDYATTPRS